MDVVFWGAVSFGAVIGWVTSGCYVGLTVVDLTWISSLIGVVGGAAVTALFKEQTLFAGYCIGLLMFFPGQFFQGTAGGTLGRNIAKALGWEIRERDATTKNNPPATH